MINFQASGIFSSFAFHKFQTFDIVAPLSQVVEREGEVIQQSYIMTLVYRISSNLAEN